ncbi:putative nucleolar complex protein 14 [Trichinella pseudospiralis]|uniref:Putative nucleolar complex protein 14 n=2 Tax=Trichinella pseudospiralis TaxID=6337 RepID=A0A0V1JHZ6_TRIPS|nr:putative nucleolar complex protein 14 [Trichinella pseudospiralis]KRZ34554.1 putative nucleolar complex protein 14 [Trichinella pseudospiralis]KRZ45491.1 putative nucleolar complex protein 14 [Trichinella pseudospiralis]
MLSRDMAKKSKRKRIADRARRQIAPIEKPANPFDLKFNRSKKTYSDGKSTSAAHGKPLTSKEKSFRHRQQTLLPELRALKKHSRVIDRRLGENRPDLSRSEKAALRFAAERQKRYKKTSKFILAEEDDDKSLVFDNMSIEEKKYAHLFDNDDEEMDQQLDDELVESTHFSTTNHSTSYRSRDDIIQEMIENSKNVKEQIKIQREDAMQYTEEADNVYRELLQSNVLGNVTEKPDKSTNDIRAPTDESYGLFYKQLILCGQQSRAADKQKSANEIAASMRNRLVELEHERKRNQSVDDNTFDNEDLVYSEQSLPYTFDMPDCYLNFVRLLKKNSCQIQGLILDRLIILHHPSLAEDNFKKLKKLLSYTVRYFTMVCRKQGWFSMDLVNRLTGIIHTLCKYDKNYVGQCFLKLLKNYYEKYKSCPSRFPSFDFFAYLQMVHVVLSACKGWSLISESFVTLISNTLAELEPKNIQDLIKLLLLMSILLSYIQSEKRNQSSRYFVPELNAKLYEIFEKMACVDPGHANAARLWDFFQHVDEPPPSEAATTAQLQQLIEFAFFQRASSPTSTEEELSKWRNICLRMAVQITSTVVEFWSGMASFGEIFRPLLERMDEIHERSENRWPKWALADLSTLGQRIRMLMQASGGLSSQPNRLAGGLKVEPKKEFTFLEPKLEKRFDPARPSRDRSTEKDPLLAEHKKLTRLYKREHRGAVRELRRDNEFLARQRMQEDRQRDLERQQKTNVILQQLRHQQYEYNKTKKV